jgi:hypothetical protein
MKHLFLLLISFLVIMPLLFSQEDDDETSNFGANKRHYAHAYFNTGFMLSSSDGSGGDIIYGKSHSITTGIRYKLKFTEVFAIGADLNYTYHVWHLKQTDNKQIPNNVLYDKEKLLNNNLGADAFMRFNIGKRTNSVGNFIDLGAYGEWNYSNARKYYIYVDMQGDPRAFDYYITSQRNLAFLEKINYGLTARVGYGRYVLFGKYRITDMFTPEFKVAISSTEFPKLIVGLEIGLHK